MLFEYMQRRSGVDNKTFEEIVEQSNEEEMVTEFKSIFQSAKEEGIGLGIEQGIEQGIELGEEKTIQKAIKGLVITTDLSDRAIAAALDVAEDLVKKIRQDLEAAKK